MAKTIEMTLYSRRLHTLLPVYIDVFNTPLSVKWYNAFNDIIENELHLEKNYCFMGVPEHRRNGILITEQINKSIAAINESNLAYKIDDRFTMLNTIDDPEGPVGHGLPGRKLIRERLNKLHRYFEDLQGVSGHLSTFYLAAGAETRWHIRQLNLLCHEYESWVLSFRKQRYAPEWMRPSQLMCYLKSPRFELTKEDFESFGVETLARPLGGVFVGVNKAVGKHHWEVYQDEGARNVDELTTSAMRSQTEAAGDFDIEWANDPGQFEWMQNDLLDFRAWLVNNGFDPEDKSLTIGHPQVGQVDLMRSFGTTDYKAIWETLFTHLNVVSIKTPEHYVEYGYNWDDIDYMEQQIKALNV